MLVAFKALAPGPNACLRFSQQSWSTPITPTHSGKYCSNFVNSRENNSHTSQMEKFLERVESPPHVLLHVYCEHTHLWTSQ